MNVMAHSAGSEPAVGQSGITYSSDKLMMAAFGYVCVAAWETKPTRELFEIQRQHLAAVVAKHPGRACFMCIVSPGAEPPDQEVRDLSSKMMAAHGKQLAACACIIEGSGFRAAITRTVLTGIMLVVKTPSPFAFLETVEAGCRWFETKICRESLPDLLEQIERARAQMKH
jgi:hypothetical protein